MALRLIRSFSIYALAERAINDDQEIKTLVKHLTASRQMSLAILCGIFAIKAARADSDTAWVIAFILLTLSLCFLYDGLDVETFKTRIKATGIPIFAMINSLPMLIIVSLLFREMIWSSGSTVAVALQVTLVLSATALQVLAEICGSIMSKWRQEKLDNEKSMKSTRSEHLGRIEAAV
ncbi:hypothetical protein C8J56DRAFT_940822 [Mycena floridula]|nr:hypothetical protein C8J56DRAFT_940822 [Mycena floridula]